MGKKDVLDIGAQNEAPGDTPDQGPLGKGEFELELIAPLRGHPLIRDLLIIREFNSPLDHDKKIPVPSRRFRTAEPFPLRFNSSPPERPQSLSIDPVGLPRPPDELERLPEALETLPPPPQGDDFDTFLANWRKRRGMPADGDDRFIISKFDLDEKIPLDKKK